MLLKEEEVDKERWTWSTGICKVVGCSIKSE